MRKIYVVIDENSVGREVIVKVFGSQVKAWHFVNDKRGDVPQQKLKVHWFKGAENVYIVVDRALQGREAIVQVFGSKTKADCFVNEKTPEKLEACWFEVEKRFI